jgi:phosphoserine phosphatase RsbU/P
MAFPPSTESRLALVAPQNSAGLWRASEWLKNQGANQAMPAEQLDRLDLILNEALANVIDHGGPAALASPIGLSVRFNHLEARSEATVTVTDGGNPFNPLNHTQRSAPPSLDEAIPGGLGIQMMRTLADELRYAYKDDQNHLVFTVRWEQSGAAPADSPNDPGIRVLPFQRNYARFLPPEAERREPGIGWMPLFRGTDEAAVINVLNDCDVLILSPGTPLLKPGAANDSIFILLSGSLSACLDIDLNPEATIPIEPGECIGEISAIDGKPVTALVVATSEARILEVPPEFLFNRLLTIPGVARNVMIALTERMRRTNETMMAAQRKQLDLQHLRQELEVARELQASMLPLRSPMFPERSDIDVAAAMEPASEVGGDMFDAFFVDEQHLFICIGDVSGHGIPAALFMARSIGLMRIAAMGTLQPAELIEKINDQLCIGNETNLFVTLFCGFLNVATGRLVYSNGGHCAPILVSENRAAPIPIPRGTLVGAIPKLKYRSNELTLNAGDTLVCYTDGVTEAQSASGEEYSEERLTGLLLRASKSAPAAMMDAVRRDVGEFTGNQALEDDCTLLAIRRRGAAK